MSVVVEPILETLAAGQWGLFTTAQARARGVSWASLSHRERDGRLERLTHGVYRLGGVPVAPLQDLRAVWISTEPETLAWNRTTTPEVVVGGAAAALIHECGDLRPVPYRLITRHRRQTQRPDIAYSWRPLEARDVVIVAGLPVTSIERTIADLIDEVGDLSLVGDVLADAARGDRALDFARLAVLLAPYATRYGHARGDGTALLDQLRRSARIDDASVVLELVQRPSLGAALQEVMSRELEKELAGILATLENVIRVTDIRAHRAVPPTPALPEQSRLLSDIAERVLAPVFAGYRGQVDQIMQAITAQLPTVRVPTIPFPASPGTTANIVNATDTTTLEHPRKKDTPSGR
jgi:hypothetical protein